MSTKLQQNIKSLSFVILIFIGMFLLTNTNNNQNIIIQRIFRPIHIGTGTLYYATLIPVLLIFFSLKQIYKQKNYTFLNTRFSRFIILVVLLYSIPMLSQSGLILYKGFSGDLNSIYCYRNNMNLSVKTIEDRPQAIVKLDLENCSSKRQEFYVKVNLPSYVKAVKESALVNTKTAYVLNAKERRQLEITIIESSINNGNSWFSSTSDFEFSLYNDLQEVKFTQSE